MPGLSSLKFHIRYQIIVWSLVIIALIMAGGFLIISYTYQVQDTSNTIIEENISNIRAAKELEITLHGIRAISLNYIIDKDSSWVESLREKEVEFARVLENARQSANTTEETLLIRQIGALFSNYEQNLKNAMASERQGDTLIANALLVHGSRDLINTIEDKCLALVLSNQNSQASYEKRIRRNNDIVRTAMYWFGIGGLALGLILGWLVARILLNPIYKLVLKVRDAAGSELVEHVRMSPGKELEEIDLHINRMISRINQAHEELRQNQELLEKSSKLAAIGKIAPAIAHEIRNPLAAIKMLIYTMKKEGGISEEKSYDLQVILGEISRMENFLQSFLQYARPVTPQLKEVEVLPVIREMIHLMAPQMTQNRIELKESFAEARCYVQTDTDQLKQVLMNLLRNATEAMQEGGVLTVATALSEVKLNEGTGSIVRIVISDTGHGIPGEVIGSLFDPFVKGGATGTGLGLSISQRIIELHHGWISAVNNPTKGATFTIHLPVSSITGHE
ncbi:MAG: MCP four helix bundle domain-containing protein [Bacteroidales bacterium]|nr:MCP four helix bundle domain-containing protein [Bacteroidales bacterium]